MIWESIGNDRRGPTDLLIMLRLVRQELCEMFKTKRHTGINMCYVYGVDLKKVVDPSLKYL
jgi:hypothetical protein